MSLFNKNKYFPDGKIYFNGTVDIDIDKDTNKKQIVG